MFNEELGVFIGIPSKSRPFRVKEQEKLMGCKPTWFVPREEVKQYEDEGAITFPCDEIGLPQQRNYALEEAFKNNQTAVLLDDDLIGFNFIYHDKTLKPLTFVETVQAMKREVNIFKLAGNSSGTNLFWYDPKRPTSKKSPVGGIFLIKPSEPRYDPALRYNEDMDFSIQHYVKYGGLIKINYIQNKNLRISLLRGLFAAEGNVSIMRTEGKDYINQITFSLHLEEGHIIKIITDILDFESINCRVNIRIDKTTKEIHISNWRNYKKLWDIQSGKFKSDVEL